MEKKKKTERLVANLKDNESYLLEHCLKQEEGMSNYLKKLVIKDMQGNSDVAIDDNLVAKRLLDMLFEHNYSLVAPSSQNSFKQEVNVSANTPDRLTVEKEDNADVFETQEFEDDDFLS